MILTKRVEHLGLVVGTWKFLEIAQFLDERISKLSNNSKLTVSSYPLIRIYKKL
ncbi:MAG: hypothetical protein ACI4V7_10445 [Succinivibrionaceae bacterium]